MLLSIFLFLSFIVLPIIIAVKFNKKINKVMDEMPVIQCSVCGHSFKLKLDSSKCRKCKTRHVKTPDGTIKAIHN